MSLILDQLRQKLDEIEDDLKLRLPYFDVSID